MCGTEVEMMKPKKEINEPTITTLRQPYLFAKADAIGPQAPEQIF